MSLPQKSIYIHIEREKCVHSKFSHRGGFTLIELAIVLVVIGLIAGGILVGKDLIEASKRIRVISEKTKFEIAFQQFKSQYNALPGDYSKAYAVWGASCAGTGSNNHCSGNGNGYIDSTGSYSENQGKAFCHFQLSGVIPELNSCPLFGPNVPTNALGLSFSPMSKGFTDLNWDINAGWIGSPLGGSGDNIYGKYQNMLHLRSNFGAARIGAGLTPINVKAIDDKIDDGKASTGKVVGLNGRYGVSGSNGNCVTPNNRATEVTSAEYVMTTTVASCSLAFFLD